MSNKKRRYQSLPAPWFINQFKKLKPDKKEINYTPQVKETPLLNTTTPE
ncbi:hypothetical protein V6525_004741 [Salmonella enterica]|nr:hypothetical protein [Salmonella enterica subsp. enterica]EGC6171841.1 hypothetical protein [Salmonella enterica]EDX0932748.1 hypothetical protein [Salmonella enterica subsp. enterica]EIE4826493.1 hypothetical protein [Salmonella enterica]EKF3190765.1 hypothetical protein [Salmonella enterica]